MYLAMYHTVLYNNNTNIDPLRFCAGSYWYCPRKKNIITFWNPPFLNRFKWNTDASRVEAKKSRTINYVCRGEKEKIHYSMDKSIGDASVLFTETVAIREVIEKAIQLKMDNLIM